MNKELSNVCRLGGQTTPWRQNLNKVSCLKQFRLEFFIMDLKSNRSPLLATVKEFD